MPTPDGIDLSPYERHLLAELEARAEIEDPVLAFQLRRQSWGLMLTQLRRWRLSERLPGWAPGAVAAAGLVLTLVAVAAAAWLSLLSVALLVAGGCGLGARIRNRIHPEEGRSHPTSPRAPAG